MAAEVDRPAARRPAPGAGGDGPRALERLRLTLEPGLNVLTGETGAGKSLLIDALGLALGARADTGARPPRRDTARVEALFDRVPEPLIAVREVAAGGPVHGPRWMTRPSPRPARRRRPGGWSRSTGSTTSSGCSTRTGSGTCSTRTAGTRGAGGVADAVERWRANRAALAELDDRAARAAPTARDPRSTRRRRSRRAAGPG